MIALIIGTRPEAIKLAPLVRRIPAEDRCLVYTGQHYDQPLATDVWADCGGYEFQHVLKIVGDSDTARLGNLIADLARFLPSTASDWVVVQGDTTSALAGALAARKSGLRVYHVEAGCRSGDPNQPEEWNRKAIDHLSSGWAYAYPCDGTNLKHEGIYGAIHSGDIGVDALLEQSAQPATPTPGRIVATIHRGETLADSEAVKGVAEFLCELARQGKQVEFYRHPHTARVMTDDMLEGVDVREPPSPKVFRRAIACAEAVVTDSGGVMVEAAYLGVPCLVARRRTESKDLLRWGKIMLGGVTNPGLARAFQNLKRTQHPIKALEESWTGKASEKIADALLNREETKR